MLSLYIIHSISYSVTIELIQVDSEGEPVSAGEILRNLENVAENLAKSGILPGAEVESVVAVVPGKIWS